MKYTLECFVLRTKRINKTAYFNFYYDFYTEVMERLINSKASQYPILTSCSEYDEKQSCLFSQENCLFRYQLYKMNNDITFNMCNDVKDVIH